MLFRRVLRPLAPIYFLPGLPSGHAFLPEHLELRDCFFVKYSAAAGGQRSLVLHTDGSIFSFNILLSDPNGGFEGGGTFFEPSGVTVRPARGCALGHSGQVRHCGVEITRGDRYLLVGFVGCRERPYELQQAELAAHDAYLKFGEGAWDRSKLPELSKLAHGRSGRRRRPSASQPKQALDAESPAAGAEESSDSG